MIGATGVPMPPPGRHGNRLARLHCLLYAMFPGHAFCMARTFASVPSYTSCVPHNTYNMPGIMSPWILPIRGSVSHCCHTMAAWLYSKWHACMHICMVCNDCCCRWRTVCSIDLLVSVTSILACQVAVIIMHQPQGKRHWRSRPHILHTIINRGALHTTIRSAEEGATEM